MTQPTYAEAAYEQSSDALRQAHEQRKAIAETYTQWIALQDIPIAGVNAFNRGNPVPPEHVERFGLEDDGLVAPFGSPEARQAQGLPAEAERPKASASKAEWVDFAAAIGMDRRAAQEFTRDELRDKFAEPEPATDETVEG